MRTAQLDVGIALEQYNTSIDALPLIRVLLLLKIMR